MQILELIEAPPVVYKMAELREAPLFVSRYVGIRDVRGSPFK